MTGHELQDHTTDTHIIPYVEDFIIIGTGDMIPEIQNLRKIMKSLHLSLNEEKTGITEAENNFDFLAFHFVRYFSRRRNKRVTRWFPPKTSLKAIKQKIREKTGNKALFAMTLCNALWEAESILKGWVKYFRHSTCGKPFARRWGSAEKTSD